MQKKLIALFVAVCLIGCVLLSACGGGTVFLTRAAFYRTARKIMDGYVYIKKSVFQES